MDKASTGSPLSKKSSLTKMCIRDSLCAVRQRGTAPVQQMVQPKADYFDTFVNSEDCTCIRNFCKEIGIPETVSYTHLDVYKRQAV